MDNDNKFVVRRSQNRPGKFGVFKGLGSARGLDPAKGANMRARREARANRPAPRPGSVNPNFDTNTIDYGYGEKPIHGTPDSWGLGAEGAKPLPTFQQPVNPGGQVVPPQAGGEVNPRPFQRPPFDKTRFGTPDRQPYFSWVWNGSDWATKWNSGTGRYQPVLGAPSPPPKPAPPPAGTPVGFVAGIRGMSPPQGQDFDGYLGYVNGQITKFTTAEEAQQSGATGIEPNYRRYPQG